MVLGILLYNVPFSKMHAVPDAFQSAELRHLLFFLIVQGLYEESIRYYVRALAMNPKADNAWQYLRISLRYAASN